MHCGLTDVLQRSLWLLCGEQTSAGARRDDGGPWQLRGVVESWTRVMHEETAFGYIGEDLLMQRVWV